MKLGGGLETALELSDYDLLSFNALLESVLRIHAAQKSEDAWTTAVAAQGSADNIKDWIRQRWESALRTGESSPDSDLGAFLAKIGQTGK